MLDREVENKVCSMFKVKNIGCISKDRLLIVSLRQHEKIKNLLSFANHLSCELYCLDPKNELYNGTDFDSASLELYRANKYNSIRGVLCSLWYSIKTHYSHIRLVIAKRKDKQRVVCPKCGNIKYIELEDANRRCSKCNNIYDPISEDLQKTVNK